MREAHRLLETACGEVQVCDKGLMCCICSELGPLEATPEVEAAGV